MYRSGEYAVKRFSSARQSIRLILNESARKHTIHAVLEIDVTDARDAIRDIREKTGRKPSFTGWMVKCIAEALTRHPELNTYRQGWRKIVMFEDVDVAIPVERTVNGEPRTMVYIIRQANDKHVGEITGEIRAAQHQEVSGTKQVLGDLSRLEKFVLNAPTFLKKLMLWILRWHGVMKKKHMGTVGVTAVGTIGRFPGWLVPLGGTPTVMIALGGITEKPAVVDGDIEAREMLSLTLSVDHDLVDGGPMTRYVDTLTELAEGAFGLSELRDDGAEHE